MSGLVAIYRRLSQRLAKLRFAPPVTHVYDPLTYAAAAHDLYCQKFGSARGRVLFLGMNPGPFGMAQTGVPFGEVAMVRDWIGIEAPIGKPPHEHPKRPVEGFQCKRSEVSGRRLWGFFRDEFGTAQAFFDQAFVANYCPLVFVAESGANITPDKLPKSERDPLYASCDAALAEVLEALAPRLVIGVGDFARKCAERIVSARGAALPVGTVLHPSPASPAANRGWAEAARASLVAQGVLTS